MISHLTNLVTVQTVTAELVISAGYLYIFKSCGWVGISHEKCLIGEKVVFFNHDCLPSLKQDHDILKLRLNAMPAYQAGCYIDGVIDTSQDVNEFDDTGDLTDMFLVTPHYKPWYPGADFIKYSSNRLSPFVSYNLDDSTILPDCPVIALEMPPHGHFLEFTVVENRIIIEDAQTTYTQRGGTSSDCIARDLLAIHNLYKGAELKIWTVVVPPHDIFIFDILVNTVHLSRSDITAIMPHLNYLNLVPSLSGPAKTWDDLDALREGQSEVEDFPRQGIILKPDGGSLENDGPMFIISREYKNRIYNVE